MRFEHCRTQFELNSRRTPVANEDSLGEDIILQPLAADIMRMAIIYRRWKKTSN